jgi:zinc protease
VDSPAKAGLAIRLLKINFMRMKLFKILPLIFLTLACASGDQGNSQTDGIFPYPIYQKAFPNGLNVITVPYESPGIASFYIIVRAGSREEVEPGKTGFAHFFEHMMFRGTDKYPTAEYSGVLKSIGAAANANTWLDRTIYHMTGNAEMLEKMFEIEADRFQNLNYSVHDFKTEAGAVKGEYTKNYASPMMQLNEKTVDIVFDNHTYKHTTMGFWEDIVDMPNQYEYSLMFFDRFYRPEYSTILVVGDVTPELVNGLAEKYFGNWEKGSYKPEIPLEPEQTATRFAHVQTANFPPFISLNYKSPAFNPDHKESASLAVISQILFSQKSELYKKLVIKERKCRYLGGGAMFTRDPYLFSIRSSLHNAEDMQLVKDEIIKSIQNLIENGVDPKVLNDTKSHMKYDFETGLDSSSSIAQVLSYSIWVTGDPEALGRFYNKVETLTIEDLQEVAKKYFIPEHLTISTISAEEEGGIS